MLPKSLISELFNAADPVITNVLSSLGTKPGMPKGEVSAVKALTLAGFDGIAAAWAPILKACGYRIELRAVFCHSRPHVTFAPVPHPKYPGGATPRRCELADLLIVMDHIDRRRKVNDRRAVLVQAKMLKGGAVKLSGKEWVQHELLAWRPPFTFVDCRYDSRSRDLDKAPCVGQCVCTTEYGGIDLTSSPPRWQSELTCKAAPWVHSPISLAGYLARMATGVASCSRRAVKGGVDDWSFTVDELLRETASLPITKRSGLRRGNNNFVGLISNTSLHAGDGGTAESDDTTSEWSEGPISTAHMTMILGDGEPKG